jgi:hypothetical protein
MSLSSDDRRRLVNILGMLGSDHDGERAAAGLLASKLLKGNGIRWDDVIVPESEQLSPRPEPPSRSPAARWPADLALCRRNMALLNNWERQFVATLAPCPRRRLTPKQIAKLGQIGGTP